MQMKISSFWHVNCAFNKSCSFGPGAERVNLGCWGWSGSRAFPGVCGWGPVIPTDSVIHGQGILTPPSILLPMFRRAASSPPINYAALIYFLYLSPRAWWGHACICIYKIFPPLAGGFRETRLIFGTWDLSCCISRSLDVLANNQKNTEKLGNEQPAESMRTGN